ICRRIRMQIPCVRACVCPVQCRHGRRFNLEEDMRMKFFFPVMVLALLATGTTYAQMPETLPSPAKMPDSPLPGTPGYVSMPMSPANGPVPLPVPHQPPVPDDWILYRKCEACCGPLGGDGPLRSELYIQSGWSFPVGGGTFGETLTTGW